jgi:hypothetical protein
VFKLILIIYELIRFSRDAKTFLGQSERLLDEHDPHDAYALRMHYRRILFFAVVMPVCGLIAALVTPLAVVLLGDVRGTAGAAVATFLGVLFWLAVCIFYLFGGVALGCFLAPPEFMDSPVGVKWLKLIGTKSPTAARVVCFITVVAALLIMMGLSVLQIVLMYSQGLNK